MAEPILKLTFEERKQIEIDGKLYEILGVDDLDFADALLMEQNFKPLSKFIGKDGEFFGSKAAKDPKAVKALGKAAKFLTDTLLQAPANVKNKLSDLQRSRILYAVFSSPGDTPENSVSLPASSGSTEETPAAG